MKIEFNYFWGLLGFLGLMGYVLENSIYYIFFAFFLLFLVPVFNKDEEGKDYRKNRTDNYDLSKIIVWLAYTALTISGLVLIIWKTVDDVIAVTIFLSIMILSVNYFPSIGMDKPKDERLRKIGTMAATWSWYATISFIGFLLVFSSWSGREYNAAEAFGVTIFVMAITNIISSAYLSYKGDIE